jgi:hypothetical protein
MTGLFETCFNFYLVLTKIKVALKWPEFEQQYSYVKQEQRVTALCALCLCCCYRDIIGHQLAMIMSLPNSTNGDFFLPY